MLLKTYLQTKRIYNRKIVIPILKSEKPLNEIALGIQIGVFWGLTPTAGFQIYIVLLQWLVQKYIFKKKFDIILAVTMIWISNPITVIPLYILFYKTGYFILIPLGYPLLENSSPSVLRDLMTIFTEKNIYFIEKIFSLFLALFNRWGIVTFFGSLFYAIPCSLIGYYFTKRILFPFKEIRKKRKSKSLKVRK